MPEPRFTPEDIIDLAEQLRSAQFNIGLQQYIAAEDLMIALLVQGRLPEDPRQWKSLLGPIFCSNPLEQEQFPQLFDVWLSRKPNLVKQVEQAKQAELDEVASPVETVQAKQLLTIADALRWFARHPAWSAAIALTLAALLTAVLMFKLDRELTAQVFSQTGNKALPAAEVEFLNQKTVTDAEGRFSIKYQIRLYDWLTSNRLEQLSVAHIEHYLETRPILVKTPVTPPITLQPRPPDVVTPPPPPTPTPTPDSTVQPKDDKPQEQPNRWLPVLIALIPLMLLALFLVWRWIRNRMMLRKLETSGTPQLHKVTFKREDAPMFVSSLFRRTAQELRRHRRTSHQDLDVTATVNATIRKGVFTPIYTARRTAPEYLLLIDRASVHDSQAKLANELAQRLSADQVYLDQFYFQEDARTLREPKPLSSVITLHDLASRYPDHRLLVFSDARGFFNPFTAEPGQWLQQFNYWEQRFLLTPVAAKEWGYYESTLAEDYGFTLIPAKTEGLAALANLLNFELSPEHDADEVAPFPELIARDAERWLDSREPKPEVIEKFCLQVKNYLGEDGWLWLAACAVYPQIKWEITLYLGGRLKSQYPARKQGDDAASSPLLTRGVPTPDGDWAESVLRLVRLPWFRFGRMPDWMRDQLIASFTAKQDHQVRRIVTDLLDRIAKDPTQPLTLDFAEPEAPREKWKAFKQRLSQRYEQWRQHRQFFRLFQSQPADSPLRDFVFLRFLAGQNRKRLGVKPPDLLRRILFNEGLAALGIRATTASVAAVVLSAALLFSLWPKPPKPLQSPNPDELMAINSGTPTPTPDGGEVPTPTVTPPPSSSPSPTASPRNLLVRVPDLIGLNVRRSIQILTQVGLTANIVGTGIATSQLPPPNSTVSVDSVVSVYFDGAQPPDRGLDATLAAGQTDPRQANANRQVIFAVTQTAEGYSVNLGASVRPLELVSLRGGTFTMGSNEGFDNEKPPHQVQVSPFAMGKFEVTQAQWMAVMGGKNPSRFEGDDLPVVNVSWNDVQQFIKQLNDKTGSQQFRLPTEAEWEYAARAGTNTEYSFGDDEKLLGQYAWYYDNSKSQAHPVGKLKPNQFGLYDMHGNVWEWCEDDWHDNYNNAPTNGSAWKSAGISARGLYQVIRGGSWDDGAVMYRSAFRYNDSPTGRYDGIGFRLARTYR